jgi:phage shock protein C
MTKRLYRSNKDIMISGVCGGIAEYFNIDPTIVRIVTILLTVASFSGLVIAYIIGMIIIPKRPTHHEYETEFYESEDGITYEEREKKTKNIVGISLIAIGVFFLMQNYFWWFDKFSFWSLILIVLGIILIFSTRKKSDHTD